jgi:hypothetical protein
MPPELHGYYAGKMRPTFHLQPWRVSNSSPAIVPQIKEVAQVEKMKT